MMMIAQGMMEFVENSDKALAALEKRDAAKQQSNEVNHDNDNDIVIVFVVVFDDDDNDDYHYHDDGNEIIN